MSLEPPKGFAEDELLPLSALQHLLFCPRQCALIHVEQLWLDNRLTVEGGHLHQRVDEAPGETRGGVRTARGVAVRSLRLGLIGKADVVEFLLLDEGRLPTREFAAALHGEPHRLGALLRDGVVACVPVEYKRGRPKRDRSDEVQLCAQGLCLEEMLEASIPAGALYYGQTRHRLKVPFDSSLRAETEGAARRLHDLLAIGMTPRARREPKCDSCSLLALCMPDPPDGPRSAARYLERALQASALPPDFSTIAEAP